ncbi:hypothetical protein [Moritella viscosa]|uniref:hypothetical protein n=1 Tax=Moritella viscosa TaxID=80854 RepID=UPI0009140C30|nr:hypothetical protein [Moritella viscosa]SGY88107.1 Putative uncharacterized protein [Moritella viscosa]SGZ10075.1 Putative uncharacterized protein [Moritella viscosa]SHO28302.1 Putative uncharacterized protein [Moritella viscosa]
MSTTIVIQLKSPAVSIEEFATDSGQTVCAVTAQMDRGFIPFIQQKHRSLRLVNVAKLTQMCLESNNDKPWLA